MARWVRGWDVESDSSDSVYRVSISDQEEWGCSCPVWKFRRQVCKHILKIQSEINWQEGNIPEVVDCVCKLGNDLCIGDEYHPEDCDVYIEGRKEEDEN